MARVAPPPQRRAAPRDSAWTACAAQPRPARACVSRAASRGRKAPAAWPLLAPKSVEAVPTDRRAPLAAVARPRTAPPVPAPMPVPPASAQTGFVATARATAPVCRATRLVAWASALPSLRAAIHRMSAAWAATFAARPATAQAPATIRKPEHPADPVKYATATAYAGLIPLPIFAAPAAPGEEARAAAVARVVPAAAASAAQVARAA